MIGNKYGMSGALPSIQDKWVQFEEEDDGVQDISEFRYYQKKISPPPRPQETAKTPKQISPSQKKHSLSSWQNVKTHIKLVPSHVATLGPVASNENSDFPKFSLNFYKQEILSLMQ